jgi:hypothetical protein
MGPIAREVEWPQTVYIGREADGDIRMGMIRVHQSWERVDVVPLERAEKAESEVERLRAELR